MTCRKGTEFPGCFNPRSHEGNDLPRSSNSLVISVSIHVPTRGTTTQSWTFPRWRSCFNPRSRKGNDFWTTTGLRFTYTMFQSTFPQGERRVLILFAINKSYVSIHVPARGTTTINRKTIVKNYCFNPRSRKGNDWLDSGKIFDRSRFNPRSRKGNDFFTIL